MERKNEVPTEDFVIAKIVDHNINTILSHWHAKSSKTIYSLCWRPIYVLRNVAKEFHQLLLSTQRCILYEVNARAFFIFIIITELAICDTALSVQSPDAQRMLHHKMHIQESPLDIYERAMSSP